MMDLAGAHSIPLPRCEVWAALNDPETLRACIPGCRELRQTSPTRFCVRIVTRIGPLLATFEGKVAQSEVDPGRAFTLSGCGLGGVAGFARGSVRIALADAEAGLGTRLTYKAKAEIGGKLAGLVLEGVARAATDQFFADLVARLADGDTTRMAAPIRLDAPRLAFEAAPRLVATAVAVAAGWTFAALALARRSRD